VAHIYCQYVNLLCAIRITMLCRPTVLKYNVFQLIVTFSDLKFNNNDNKDYNIYKEYCLII